MIDIVPLRAFKDNYIWVIRHENYAAVVDPGDPDPVLKYLTQENLKLVGILTTHHHHDHTGGNLKILESHPVPVYGPAQEIIAGTTHRVEEGSSITLPELGLKFSVLHVPPHTAGHVAYYGANMVFCGDTLFGCGCGGISEGTPEQMLASLAKLAALPESTAVYCGHEYTLENIKFALTLDPSNPTLHLREQQAVQKLNKGLPTLPSTIGLEKQSNPFLRYQHPTLLKAIATYYGSAPKDPATIFTTLKKMEKEFLASL